MAGHPLAEEFFQGVVQPTVDEYLAQPANIRRGRLAAIVLSHLVDYWHVDTGESKNTIHAALRADTLIPNHPGYSSADIVRDLADASKHAKLDRKNPPPQLTDAGQVQQHYLGATGTDTVGLVPTGMPIPTDVRVTLDDGKSFILSYVIRALPHKVWVVGVANRGF